MADKILKALWLTLAIIVLGLGVVLFTSWYSNGWESLSALYVKYDGTALKKTATLAANSKATFHIKSAGFLDKTENCTVIIRPNTKTKFKYTVNGEEKQYTDIEELTSAFEISVSDTSFVIDLTGFKGEPQTDMQTLLERYHGEGSTIEITDSLNESDSYYLLEVRSEDGVYSSKTNFKVLNKQVLPDGIIIDPDKVIL